MPADLYLIGPPCRCYVVQVGPPRVITPPLDGSGCPVHCPVRPMNMREALELLDILDPSAAEGARADLHSAVDELGAVIDRLEERL